MDKPRLSIELRSESVTARQKRGLLAAMAISALGLPLFAIPYGRRTTAERYAPCACGSGKKAKFCCLQRKG